MHSIRLNGPWILERPANEQGDETTGPGKLQVPRDLGVLSDLRTRQPVTLIRKFNSPTGLTEATRVFVVIRAEAGTSLKLNGRDCSLVDGSADGSLKADVTPVLRQQLSHELKIELPTLSGGQVQQGSSSTDWLALLEIHDS